MASVYLHVPARCRRLRSHRVQHARALDVRQGHRTAWGSRRFLNFYFLCGSVAGVCVIVAELLFGNPFTNTIGASGAIYGLLVAFGMMYPDVTVLFSFLFPIKAKYFVMIIGAIAFLTSFQANTGVSNFAHLGGYGVRLTCT